MLLHYRRTGDNEWLGHLLQRYTLLLLGVAAAVVGPRTVSQLEQILEVEAVELPPKIRDALDDATAASER